MRVVLRSSSALCALLLAIALLPATAAATSTQTEIDAAIAAALAFAPTQQDPATGEPPAYEHSGFYSGEWLASGYAAVGLNAADVRTGDNPSLQDFLAAEAADFWNSPTPIAPENTTRLILAAAAAGIDTARVSAEQNLPAELIATWKPLGGGFGEPNTFSTAWGVLALRTTPLPAWALQPLLSYLRADQHSDGGWSFFASAEGEESDPDITAAAVGALCTAGVPAYDPAVADGLAYLNGLLVNATGAVHHEAFGDNVDTTAWTVNALQACGIDPQSDEWKTAAGKTPIDHILSLQLKTGPEAGGFAWAPGEPWFPPSTGHALRALSGAAFAVAPPSRENPALPRVRPAPAVAAGTPVPHVLAIELAPGNVKLCSVTAPAGAPLAAVLSAAEDEAVPSGCVTSFSLTAGELVALDGVTPDGEDEAWLLRLDRGAAKVAAEQPVGFGESISLRIGQRPVTASGPVGPQGPAGAPGTGQQGPAGKPGAKGKPGRNARRACKPRARKQGKRRGRCAAKHRLGPQGPGAR